MGTWTRFLPKRSQKQLVLFCVLSMSNVLFYVLLVCKCVLYYCHQVSTQLQLTNMSYHNFTWFQSSAAKRTRPALFRDVTLPVVLISQMSAGLMFVYSLKERKQIFFTQDMTVLSPNINYPLLTSPPTGLITSHFPLEPTKTFKATHTCYSFLFLSISLSYFSFLRLWKKKSSVYDCTVEDVEYSSHLVVVITLP